MGMPGNELVRNGNVHSGSKYTKEKRATEARRKTVFPWFSFLGRLANRGFPGHGAGCGSA